MALVSSAEGLMVDITLSNVGGVVLDFIDDDREDKFILSLIAQDWK